MELLTHAALKEGYCPDILTKEYAELLIKAAPMHDIGKITIPDSILQKNILILPRRLQKDTMKNGMEVDILKDLRVPIFPSGQESWQLPMYLTH